MTRAALFLLLLLGASLAVQIPPTVTINLDDAPQFRFRVAVRTVLSKHTFASSFQPIIKEFNPIMSLVMANATVMDTINKALSRYYPDTVLENQGISDELAAAGYNVSLDLLNALTYYHELAHDKIYPGPTAAHECTSLFLRNWDGQRIYHGRDMDHCNTPSAARALTLRLRFVKGGALLFEGGDWYWWMGGGFMSGIKAGLATLTLRLRGRLRRVHTLPFSETQRERHGWLEKSVRPDKYELCRTNRAGTLEALRTGKRQLYSKAAVQTTLEDWRLAQVDHEHLMADIAAGVMPQRLIFRYVLSTYNTYDAVLKHIAAAPIAAAWFVVVTGPGPNDGAMVTRGASDEVIPRTITTLVDQAWWVVVTNYDLWVPDPPSDARRTVIERSLNSYGQNVATLAGTYLVASSSPAANSCTVYTMAMSAAENEFTITMPS